MDTAGRAAHELKHFVQSLPELSSAPQRAADETRAEALIEAALLESLADQGPTLTDFTLIGTKALISHRPGGTSALDRARRLVDLA